ncbi:MAG TPA: ATP-binding protein [Rectinema sp.]|jgi:signal transduction histidine kinase|nr:hypothetical protein [Spirochaetaceae bacterium]HOM91567.1 ATP-binding protein [Rectinema sp.]HOR48129.1 ATP-binding protein [Rectinema sp.]HOU06008.1 ATP-binding protein [Rectinema sp.]HOW11111.1 ATP-binding protein [Rectinema sp.]
MPKIAILESDILIALDIAKSIEQEGLAEADIYEKIEQAYQDIDGLEYELFIIDIGDNQPEIIDAAIRIHRQTGLYCLVVSDHGVTSISAKLREAQPLGILVKPFSKRELIANVETALYHSSMEKKLRDRERRYRDLFAYSLSARCITDIEGSILERNRVFESSFSNPIKAENVKDILPSDMIWREIIESLEENNILQREIQTNRIIDSLEQRSRDFICSFSKFEEEGSSAQILCEFLDVTESRRLREELFQSQKREEIGRLTSGVAHDLNNFLTSIMGFLEMIKLEIPNNSPAHEDIRGIDRVVKRASGLTRQLLGFSKHKPYSPAPINLKEVMGDTYKILKRLIPENISLTLSLPEESLVVNMDISHLEQILLNLVVNARDALEKTENPHISIQLSQFGNDAFYPKEAMMQPGDYALIAVKDNGAGIDNQNIERVFEPFFTTKAKNQGTGLGLSIVKSLVEMNGGYIKLESEKGRGTTIKIWFPILMGTDTTTKPMAQEEYSLLSMINPPNNILKGRHILVVDDDESILEACTRILESAGAIVDTCINAGEAILKAERVKFDLLLTDIVLPGVYGTELWERMKKNSQAKACIFMTGYESYQTEQFAGVTLLHKPFDARTLLECCNNVLNSSIESQETI